MTFDPTKPVQTRDGRPARIVCTNRNHDTFPIVALVDHAVGTGEEIVHTYTSEGRINANGNDHCNDLVYKPEKRSVWVCVTGDRDSDCAFREKLNAEDHARAYRVKEIIELTYEVPQ